jgi:hypothetical protein
MSVDPALVTCQPAAPVPASEPTDGSVREQLLDALDFAYCQGLGYGTPEELVAAYDATLLPPTDQTALRDRIAAAIDGVFTRWQTGLGTQRPQDAIHDAVMAVLPTPADRGAIIREAADAITADAALRDTEGEHDLAEYGRELAALIQASGPGGAADETQQEASRAANESSTGHDQSVGQNLTFPVPAAFAPGMPCEHGCRAAADALAREAQAETRRPRCPRCIHDERTRAVLQPSAMELYPPDHDPDCPRAEQPAAVAQPAVHTGGNAEDCPACHPEIDKTVLYPWICPAAVAQPDGEA